jgi:hypothetical protein
LGRRSHPTNRPCDLSAFTLFAKQSFGDQLFGASLPYRNVRINARLEIRRSFNESNG